MTTDGVRIVWDVAIDRGAWPGPLGATAGTGTRTATAGELWLGPIGLLARLETELGLGRIHATSLERAGVVAAQLATRTKESAWWRASYESDRIGTCQRLLRDRDLLALDGWRGERGSARLAELWTATCQAPPGLPDRLAAVCAALAGGRRVDIARLELRTTAASLSAAWRAVLAALATAGVKVVEVASPCGTRLAPQSDLARATAKAFVPTGDGSLTLLRPQGPLAAADEVAAALAALPSLAGVLVIGADDVLDAALARHGLPCVGAPARAPASVALVRLLVEAAFEPMDAAVLHALLAIAPGPIPRGVASRLVDAISRFPARGTAEWTEALDAGIDALDEARRPRVRARVETLLLPAARASATIATVEVDRRLATLAAWAAGRVEGEPSLGAVLGVATELRALLRRLGVEAVSQVELRRLCDDIETSQGLGRGAQYGLAAVAEPGAVLAPAPMIVWWNFTRDSAPRVPRVRLSNAERVALLREGVSAPDAGPAMEGEAQRWRRPLDHATGALVLVCPATSAAGETCSPHPLWDELCASMAQPRDAALLEVTRLTQPMRAVRRAVAARALPRAAIAVKVSRALAVRPRESATSVDKLLGCSLAWALEYHGKLSGGLADGPSAPSPLLYGQLAHHLLALVFADGALDEAAASAKARELVDRELPLLAETLALPRYQVELTSVRQAVLASAPALAALIAESGAAVRGVEVSATGEHGGFAFTGTADLILEHPDVVLDLKWGKTSHRAKLESGTALQLALYAALFRRTGDPAPAVGYFSLTSRELFTPAGSTLPRAKPVGTAQAGDTWTAALAALGTRRDQLAVGELHAPAADGAAIESSLDDGALVIAPGCKYCSFSALCGAGGCT